MYLPKNTTLHNRYVIESLLGHGGFGVTYSALDTVLNVKVAIKEYLPRQSATRAEGQTKVTVFTGAHREHYEYGLRKFLEEAQSVAQFTHHSNIVSAHDYFEANGTAYMVMEYVEGVTLKEYLEQKGGKISFEVAKGIMMPVMDALREVHQACLLHRDISPDNIYITASAQVKILDFGAARYFSGEQSKSLSVILKPGYAPEEQYRSSGKQGAWTDVYAVATTFYKTLTGQTPPEALDRLAEDTLLPPSRLGVDIPSAAEQALLKALAVNASQRFQTMGEFQQAFLEVSPLTGQFQSGSSSFQPSLSPVSPPGPYPSSISEQPGASPPLYPQVPARVKNPAVIAGGIAAGVIGLVLAVGLIWMFLSRQDPPDKFLKQGIEYYTAKNYPQALTALEEAARLNPRDTEAHFYRGLTLAALNRFPPAIEAYRQAINLKSDFPQAYLNLGESYEKLERHQEAIEAWKEAARLKPDYGLAYRNLTATYWQQGQRDLALEHYKILQAKDADLAKNLQKQIPDLATYTPPKPDQPDNAADMLAQGMSYYKARDYKKAVEAFEEVIRLNPREAEAHYRLGLSNVFLGRPQNVASSFQRAFTLKPDSYSWRKIGSEFYRLGRSDDAARALNEAIRAHPNDSQAHYQLGEIALQKGEIRLAIREFQILKDLDLKLARKLEALIIAKTGRERRS